MTKANIGANRRKRGRPPKRGAREPFGRLARISDLPADDEGLIRLAEAQVAKIKELEE